MRTDGIPYIYGAIATNPWQESKFENFCLVTLDSLPRLVRAAVGPVGVHKSGRNIDLNILL